MSTVHEVIVARHCGLRVLGVSLITNRCVTSESDKTIVNSDHVLEMGRQVSEKMQMFISRIVELM